MQNASSKPDCSLDCLASNGSVDVILETNIDDTERIVLIRSEFRRAREGREGGEGVREKREERGEGREKRERNR